jgi:hypothetical protein
MAVIVFMIENKNYSQTSWIPFDYSGKSDVEVTNLKSVVMPEILYLKLTTVIPVPPLSRTSSPNRLISLTDDR